jgi:hypothetical protein
LSLNLPALANEALVSDIAQYLLVIRTASQVRLSQAEKHIEIDPLLCYYYKEAFELKG